MAEIVTTIVDVAIQLGKWVAAPITRQFNYLCCLRRNISGLESEAENLQTMVDDLQEKVDRALDDAQLISGETEGMLQKLKRSQDEIHEIMSEVTTVQSDRLNVRGRFLLSRRAKKKTQHLKELLGHKFNGAVSRLRPPAARGLLLENSYEFESRKEIEESIMATLGGGNVKMLGICGMGGLGKTTIAKRLMNRALQEDIFEEVVLVVLNQHIDKLRIQLEIGGSLGLRLEGETSQGRVQKLKARLCGTRRTLIIFDNVWERLVLEDFGIPSDHKGCTILLTSRNRDVLSGMKVEKVFGMEVLCEEDSWFLFREIAGTRVDDIEFNSIAKQVVNECRGLPIALTTLAAALKDEMSVSVWKDALRQMTQSDPDIPELIANVYNPLKLSYDVLGSKHKTVFLLCCLWPEGAEIQLDLLTYMCMGLGIFEGGIQNVEEARNRVLALTHLLNSRSLLFDETSTNAACVWMHDVVRDVGKFIAKHEGYIGGGNCNWISTFSSHELLSRVEFLNLRLLWIHGSQHEFTLDSSSLLLDGVRDLHVLLIERCSFTSSLPQAAHTLRNLNTLLLYLCQNVETLCVVGELVNLEILICRECHSVEELPLEVNGLNLKVLELTCCSKLQRIGRGIISSLVELEELKISESFNKWEGDDREERKNAGVRELESLTDLRCLEIEIEDPTLAVENFHLSSKMDRFCIKFLKGSTWYDGVFNNKYLHNRKMRLNLEGEICIGHWIEMQLRATEDLLLTGNGANKLDLANLENIRLLELTHCNTIKNLVTSIDGGGGIMLSSIEYMMLSHLLDFEHIWDGRVSSNAFQNLKEIKLFNLPALRQLWKCSSLHQNDLPLEVIGIWNCEKMEQLFEEDNNITKMFPRLKLIDLQNLPNLACLCQGIERVEFPLLSELCISECGKLESMVSENNLGGNSNGDIHHLVCQTQQVSFGRLKELCTDRNLLCSHKAHVSVFNGLERLKIFMCEGSRSLLTSSIAGNLVNLKELNIQECDGIVQVIKDDEEKGKSGGQSILLFPKLQNLCLNTLHKLVHFCEWRCEVELLSLRTVEIGNCPNFSLGFLAAPTLEHLQTDLKNNIEAPFNSLKKLSIQHNGYPLSSYQIHGSVFDGLEVLKISEYTGTLSLLSPSISGNLVSLRKLTIKHCHEIVKVIEDEDEKGRVVSGGRRTLLFPKMETLVLSHLSKMVHFCEWTSEIELPALRKLTIYKCANLKSCTLGPLSTPSLKSVGIDVQIFAVKDLNVELQQQYFTRAEKKQKEDMEKIEEEKGGEEYQETKGEIEEEQT